MLEDIKALVDIVQQIFGLHSREREKTITLLEQISKELEMLANFWKSIWIELEQNTDSLELSKLREDLSAQTSHFEALRRFSDENVWEQKSSPFNSKAGTELRNTVVDAISVKGRLYSLVHQIVYPGVPVLEKLQERLFPISSLDTPEKQAIQDADLNDPGLSEADKIYLRFQKRNLQKERETESAKTTRYEAILQEQNQKLMKDALTQLRTDTYKLIALAGNFRAQVKIYNAGL